MKTTTIINKNEFDKWKKYQYTFIKTGIDDLDVCGGITTEDFMIIAGSSGSGKSFIALFFACFMAKNGHTIVFINAEISNKTIIDRIGQLGFDYLTDFGEFNENGENRLVIINTQNVKFDDIKQLMILYKPQCLFVDLFSSLMDDLEEKVKFMMAQEYAKKLSFIPQEFNCAVVVTEQLTKDNRRVTRPTLNDIAGASALVRKSTKVLIVYRYSKENLESNTNKIFNGQIKHIDLVKEICEIIVRKDRLGLWGDGVNLMQYKAGKGLFNPHPAHKMAYMSDVFTNGKAKKDDSK